MLLLDNWRRLDMNRIIWLVMLGFAIVAGKAFESNHPGASISLGLILIAIVGDQIIEAIHEQKK